MAEAASGSDSAQGGEASPRDSETSDGSFEDWKSSAEDMEPCKCLFCEFVSVPSTIITHCTTEHGFDIMTILRARGVGDYDCIRLVNFVRRQVADSAPMDTILAAVNDNSSPLWEDDALLVPVLENDPLLYCLGEAVEVEDDDTGGAGEEESKVSGSPLEVVGHAMRPPA